jgi:hypothetical protein
VLTPQLKLPRCFTASSVFVCALATPAAPITPIAAATANFSRYLMV